MTSTINANPLRRGLLLSVGLSILSLALAYISQYGFGLAPCELCYTQRYPYMAVIVLGGLALWLARRPATRRAALFLIALLFLWGAGIAGYHTGVEQKWWPGPSKCSELEATPVEIEALREQLKSAPVIRCDEPAIEVMGITMASANAVWSFLLMVMALVFWRKGKERKDG
jgi:disulfide bond formation protein DsbB